MPQWDRLSEWLGIAFRWLEAPAFFVHKFQVTMNEQYFIRYWLHFVVLVKQSKFSRVHKIGAKEVPRYFVVFVRPSTDIFGEEATDCTLRKIPVKSLIEVLDRISKVATEQGAGL